MLVLTYFLPRRIKPLRGLNFSWVGANLPGRAHPKYSRPAFRLHPALSPCRRLLLWLIDGPITRPTTSTPQHPPPLPVSHERRVPWYHTHLNVAESNGFRRLIPDSLCARRQCRRSPFRGHESTPTPPIWCVFLFDSKYFLASCLRG